MEKRKTRLESLSVNSYFFNISKKLAFLVLVFSFILAPFEPVLAAPTAEEPVSAPAETTTTAETPAPESAPAITEQTTTSPETPVEAVVTPEPETATEEVQTMEAAVEDETEAVDHYRNNFETNKFAQVEESDGSLKFEVQITVPPGRNGMEPNLSLQYSSKNVTEASIIASGWSLNIPYIERVNKKGLNSMFTDDYFSSSLSGELSSTTNNTTFSAKVEDGSFIKYTYLNGSWTAVDKKGTVYKFGTTPESIQKDPNNSAKKVRWFLTEIRDTNNNFVRFEYFDSNLNFGQLYPKKVFYTGNGTTDGIFEVEFVYQDNLNYYAKSNLGFPVETKLQMHQILVKKENTLLRKYQFEFALPLYRKVSLLKKIIETGIDENSVATTLPPYEFNYQDSDTPGWQNVSTEWELPVSFYDAGGATSGAIFAEVNGDGLPDIIQSYLYSGRPTVSSVYLHNGTGWTLETSSNWDLPTGPYFYEQGDNRGYRVVDVNGDGLDDIIRSYDTVRKAYINNGNTWIDAPTWYPPVMFNLSDGKDNGVRIADINNDGLVDLIHANNKGTNSVYANTGAGWSYVFWGLPDLNFVDVSNKDNGFLEVDVNADGLTDFIRMFRISSQIKQEQFINSGNGNYEFIEGFTGISDTEAFLVSRKDNGFRMADVNGDGQTDFLKFLARDGLSHRSSYIDLGNSWQDLDTTWLNPLPFTEGQNWSDKGTRLVDFNGDGMIDVIRKDILGEVEAYTNKSKKVDLLSSITYPTGGKTSVEYKTSQQYKDTNGALLNPKVPFTIFTVSKIKHEEGGNSSESNYVYKDGSFYTGNGNIFDRKFAGFGQVVKTDPAGNVTKTYFHQGDTTATALGEFDDHISKAGKVYRTEEYDSSGNLFRLSVNKWDKASLGTDRNFVKLVRETTLQYDGNSTHADTSKEYVYDNTNGNLTQKIDNGLVVANTDGSFTDTGTDKSIENISYVNNTTNGVVGLPYVNTVSDQNLSRVRDTKIYYDNLAYGLVGAGNPTKIENWVTGSTYINSQKSYNPNGTVATETDPRGYVTSYIYDAHNLYPSTVTRPLNQITSYTYDYSSGQPKQITDANNFVYQNIYDGLGRLLEEKIPNELSPYLPVTKTKYFYTDTSGAVAIKKTDYLNKDLFVDTYQYFDGFGRLIQERKSRESLSSANFAVKDIVYNNRGLVEKETVAYGGANGGKTNPSSNNLLYTSYTYDTLGRPLTVANTLGTTNYTYDDLKTEVTDAKGKVKRFFKDVRGNLSKVEEVNSGATYTTNYVWNLNGKLTKITDALGNVRNFTYDGLGRRKTAEDLHATADTTFGVWQFSYDNTNNLTQTISPNNHTVNYTYNELNQILTEDYTGGVGTEITHVQNTCTNGKGKLCNVIVAGTGNIGYTYGPNNQPLSEIKYLGALTYTTSLTYDRQGNTTKIVYPDNSEVYYTYNGAGLLEKIERKETGGTVQTVVSNFNYTSFGALETKNFVNFVNTTFSYDANKMYRLSRIFTQNNVPANLQDLNYTYDPVGNITKIIDSSMVSTAKTVDYVYDDLHRLTSANATNAINGQNYYQGFSYNSIGNILSNPLGAFTYAGTNYANPHAATSIAGVPYTYDNNGNLLTNGTLTNTWNYKNQLTSVVKGGVTSTYKYDHEGNRVTETVGTTTTTFPNKFYNVTNSGKKTKNIYAGNELVATIETVATTTTPYYIHTDHLGSSNIVTGSAGTKVETLDYFPFGDVRLNEKVGSFDSSRKYIGEEFDDSTGLNYLNARYYNSKTGGFLSQDSVFLSVGNEREIESKTGLKFGDYLADPQAMNSYSYARNNPMKYSDKDGQFMQAVNRPVKIGNVTIGAHSFIEIRDNPNINNGQRTTLGGYTKNFIWGDLFKDENYDTDYNLSENDYLSTHELKAPDGMSQQEFEQKVYDGYNAIDNNLGAYSPFGGDLPNRQGNSGNVFTQILLNAGFTKEQISELKTKNFYDAGVGRGVPKNKVESLPTKINNLKSSIKYAGESIKKKISK